MWWSVVIVHADEYMIICYPIDWYKTFSNVIRPYFFLCYVSTKNPAIYFLYCELFVLIIIGIETCTFIQSPGVILPTVLNSKSDNC